MKVSEKDVMYVADLANLELTPAERDRMVRDLNSILDYVDVLSELDTTGVEPMAQAANRFGDVLRADEVGVVEVPSDGGVMRVERPSLPRQIVMENAPESDGTFFKVPKVIER